MSLVPILIFGKSIVEMIKKIGQKDLHFFRHKILFGFVWKPYNVRDRKNKQMRKIIFLGLNNLENSKGKNVEEKMDLLAYSPSPIFFPVHLIRVLRLIIFVLLFFFF